MLCEYHRSITVDDIRPSFMMGNDMTQISVGAEPLSRLDQLPEVKSSNDRLAHLVSENYRLKKLVIRLSAIIAKNVLRAK